MGKRVVWTPEMTRALILHRVNGRSYVELTELIGVDLHHVIAKCRALGFLPLCRRGRPAVPEETFHHITKLIELGLSGAIISERTGYSETTISRIKNNVVR